MRVKHPVHKIAAVFKKPRLISHLNLIFELPDAQVTIINKTEINAP